jgi:hypothetical protein
VLPKKHERHKKQRGGVIPRLVQGEDNLLSGVIIPLGKKLISSLPSPPGNNLAPFDFNFK